MARIVRVPLQAGNEDKFETQYKCVGRHKSGHKAAMRRIDPVSDRIGRAGKVRPAGKDLIALPAGGDFQSSDRSGQWRGGLRWDLLIWSWRRAARAWDRDRGVD